MKLVDASLPWYVITCRTGFEERAWLELRAGGFEAYCPRSRRRIFNRRVRIHRTVEVAALPGYVFLAGPVDWAWLYSDIDNREREPVEVMGKVYEIPKGIATRKRFEHVGRPVCGALGPLRIPGSVVLQISVDEMSGKFDTTGATKKANHEKLKAQFPAGRRVRPTEGLLSGFDGLVDGVTPKHRILALMTIFGRMVRVEFDPGELDAA